MNTTNPTKPNPTQPNQVYSQLISVWKSLMTREWLNRNSWNLVWMLWHRWLLQSRIICLSSLGNVNVMGEVMRWNDNAGTSDPFTIVGVDKGHTYVYGTCLGWHLVRYVCVRSNYARTCRCAQTCRNITVLMPSSLRCLCLQRMKERQF
jgi:hypothetical protein